MLTPNGIVIESVEEGDIRVPGMSAEANKAAIFEDSDLASGNLISVGQLCDAGMTVLFEKEKATVMDISGRNVLTANRDEKSGLFSVDLRVEERVGVMFPKASTTNKKAEFYAACMGSPTSSTLHRAVSKGWVKFPGTTAKDFINLPHSEATAKGHLDKTKQGLDSTKPKVSVPLSPVENNQSTLKVEVDEIDRRIFADLTGRFPCESANGMQYIMVMKCSVTGYIHVEPLGSRKGSEFTRAFQEGVKFFKIFGVTHNSVKVDNESSGIFREQLRENGMTVDFVAPNNHRQNPAERDIRTFKNHFIATLCTTDPTFPLAQWDRLLPQAELTLNLMRGSPLQPNLSSWEHLRGPYNYSRNPIAPAGTRVIVHENPDIRETWAPHGVAGFYIGPAMEHYRSYIIYIEGTRRTRVSDSVSWHPHDLHRATVTDAFIHEALDALAADIRHIRENENFVQNEVQVQRSKSPRRSNRVRQPNRKYADGADFEMVGAAVRNYKSAIKGEEKLKWECAADEEFFRLIVETETMKLISWHHKPVGRKVSYYNPQIRIKVKPGGESEYRVRGTYGGDISDYTGPTAAQTADMVSIKTLLNATVSEDADWMTMDIKDFYLGTPLPHPEYMRVHIDQMPQRSREMFVSSGMLQDGYMLFEINKGIYGLAQAGLLAQERLFETLAQNGYTSIMSTNPCIFKHCERNIFFSLVVDDFGVKYKSKEDVEHLLGVLETKYVVKTDWKGSSYVGFDIKHDKVKRVMTISMPRYIADACEKLGRTPLKTVHTPMPVQSASIDRPLSQPEVKRLQSIIGIALYYARAVDPTLLTRVSKLSSAQSSGTSKTLEDAERMFEYCMSYPDSSIHFHASEMQLICYTDASYLSESKSRSRGGGYFFLGSHDPTMLNGPILCTSVILDAVVSSAAESEYGAAFENAKEAVYIRQTLEALGYKQAPTQMVTDNSFVKSVTNGTCKVKKSKAMDMRYNWLVDRVSQGQFSVIWCEGHKNIADYFTKDLPSYRYRQMREFIVPSMDTRVSIGDIPDIKKGVTEELERDIGEKYLLDV